MKNYTFALLSLAACVGMTSLASAAEGPSFKGPKHKKLTFAQADADADSHLSIFEFAKTQGKGTPMVEIRRRFLAIDVEGLPIVDSPEDTQAPDNLISLDEWNAYRALDEKPKSDLPRFQLADFDNDGLLTPVEFGYLVSPSVKPAKILRKFNKADKDDDGFISPTEFKKDKTDDDA
jgi:hypothetical protein